MRELLLKALELPQAERYRLAFLIAESLGYTLKNNDEVIEMADNMEEVAAALVSLTESGIPPDIQELLVHGNPALGIPSGALYRALVSARAFREQRTALSHS